MDEGYELYAINMTWLDESYAGEFLIQGLRPGYEWWKPIISEGTTRVFNYIMFCNVFRYGLVYGPYFGIVRYGWIIGMGWLDSVGLLWFCNIGVSSKGVSNAEFKKFILIDVKRFIQGILFIQQDHFNIDSTFPGVQMLNELGEIILKRDNSKSPLNYAAVSSLHPPSPSPARPRTSATSSNAASHRYVPHRCNLAMKRRNDGLRVDQKMMVVVISVCAKLEDLRLGQKLHEYVWSYKLNFDMFLGNALMDMYLKCGEPDVSLS
ncbi:hypothetical protein FXO37_01150 [Capsicum annuum]|nr:hypothetical protein FXO37_01150 [Capsicum annuum]